MSLSLQCFGNKKQPNLVIKLDSISADLKIKSLEIRNLRDSLVLSLKKVEELERRLADYEEFKGESKGNDSAIWEYGSSIVGILTGIIILFGIVYYMSSKQAARDAFDESFDSYVSLINKKVKESNALLDVLESRAGILDESEMKLNESSKSIEDGYGTS